MAPDTENGAPSTGEHAPPRPFDSSPRGRLLAAAAEVIAHGGYRDATVDRIIERAHVGWDRFTREFSDLDDCLLAAVEAGYECVASTAERAEQAASGQEPAETIGAVVDALLTAIAVQPAIARLCLVDAAALGAPALEVKERGLDRFVVILARQIGAAGGRPGMPATLAAEMVVGGIHEVLQRQLRTTDVRHAPDLGADLRRIWLPLVSKSA